MKLLKELAPSLWIVLAGLWYAVMIHAAMLLLRGAKWIALLDTNQPTSFLLFSAIISWRQ